MTTGICDLATFNDNLLLVLTTAIKEENKMDTTLFRILLLLHVLSGTITLLSSVVAIGSKLADVAHKWHVTSGRLFFIGMTGIFITGLSMSMIRFNPPMLFVSIFSFYFAWMGRRYAINRKGTPSQLDNIITPVMTLGFIGMIAYGLYSQYIQGQSFGIVILVFGIIGVLNAYADWQIMRKGGATGKLRIAEHLGKMLGGTIAAITAFLVVNVHFEPAIVVWLLPTFVLTPIIFIWSAKIKNGVKRKGMVEG